MFSSFNKREVKYTSRGTSQLSARGQQKTADKSIWDEILRQFYALPKERQDEILLRIYKNLHRNSLSRRQSGEYLIAGKC